MITRGLKVNLSFVLSIALVVSAMPWICLAEDEKQDNGPLDSLKIDLGEQRTYWEDGRVTIKVAGIAKGIRPHTRLQLTDREGAVIETLYEGRLREDGLTTHIEARDLPPGSYRLRLDAESGENVSRTIQEILVILPHRDYRTYVATGCYALTEFGVGADGQVSAQSRNFEEAHMNTVLYSTGGSRSDLDAAAFVGVIGHYRLGSGPTSGPGRPLGPDGKQSSDGFFNVCFTHPQNRAVGRKEITDEFRGAGGHPAGHPALYGYIFQDEVQHHANACYCEHCRTAFRQWLNGRYVSIDKLNEVWSGNYAGFKIIDPPLPLAFYGTDAKAVNKKVNRYAWYDWLQFKDWSMADYINEFTELIHELAPGKVVANHLIPDYFSSYGFHWRDNPFVLQANVDQAQASQWGDRYGISFHANVESHVRKPAWCTGTNPFVGPRLRWAQVYSGYMHGYQGVLWFFYNPYWEGGIDFGLLELDPRGSRGARYRRAVEVNGVVRQIAPVLGKLPTAKAPIGLFWSDATVIQNPNNSASDTDRFGLYRALNRLQLEPVILLDSQLTMEQLKPLKVVLLGGAWDMPPQTAEVLREYVKAGGQLIASTNTAFYDHGHKETHALADVFGARQSSRIRLTEQLELKRSGEANAPVTYMTFNKRSIPIIGYTQNVDIDGAKVLAKAESDYKPLLMRNSFGKGSAVLASFTLGRTSAQEATDAGLELLERLLGEAGVNRPIRVRSGPTAASKRDPEVDAILRHKEGDNVWYLLAINYGEDGHKEYRINGRFSYVYDVITQQRIPTVIEGSTTRFVVEQPQYDPQAYALLEGSEDEVPLRYSYERLADHFLVKIHCPAGTLARLASRGAEGRKGKELFGIVSGSKEVKVPIYRIQGKPVELSVENCLGEAKLVP